MIKRANKITAGLVAAAAVMSLVPATGVNASDYKRIESKDGTVYNMQAYKDGTFVIDGDIVKEDNNAIYYLKDGKYTELEDLDSGDDFDRVESAKYLEIQDGDNFVDLANGKVTDDNVREDNAGDAASDLRKNVKKDTDGRYLESNYATNGIYGSEAQPDLDEVTAQIPGAKYGDTWYQTKYRDKKLESVHYNVYTDAKGKYIDADYNIGKIRVETTTGASLTLKNTDTDKLSEHEDDIQVSISNTRTIAQDSNNIYRKANIIVTSVDNIDEINGVKLDAKNSITTTAAATVTVDGTFDGAVDNFTFTKRDGKATLGEYKGCNTVEFKVIQRISKAQASDDVDGVKYAKTVTTYIISDEDGLKDGLDDSLKTATDIGYSVVNGKLIAYSKNAQKIQTTELKSKSAYYYTDIQDACDDDIEAIDTDVDGNVWSLNDGFVYQWDNDEDWDKVYKVDGSMEKISVYDKNNMAVWNEDDEVYSIIGNKEKEEKPDITTGWNKQTDGTWLFYDAAGVQVKANWTTVGGQWYYMNEDGKMATGWKNVNGNWYFLNDSGSMATGWVNVGGTWYYTNASGAMQTGWVNVGETWYFLNTNGSMAANTTVDGYTLSASGAML